MTGKNTSAGCLICGGPVIYEEPIERECAVCHRKFVSGAVCVNGHYVCDSCHAAGFPEYIRFLLFTKEKDPIVLMEEVMDLPQVHMCGPEHHMILPAVLLTAYRNCGGKIDLDAGIKQAFERGSGIAGGSCGYCGVCGASAGAGIYASIITGSNPLNADAWTLPQRLTARVSNKIADVGGVRCCKRTSFIAIKEAALWTKETTGICMEAEEPVCRYFRNNKECLGKKCPFHP